MNKKRLSVVMAGAMLASSVAPVLAAETTTQKDYTVNNSNKGLLIRDLRNFVNSKIFDNVVVNDDLAGHSVYYAKFVTTTKTVYKVGDGYATITDAINAELKYLGETAVFHASSTNGNVGKEHTVKVGNSEVTFFVTGDAKKPGTFSIKSKYDNKNFDKLESLIQDAATGSKVEVWDNGHIEKDGRYYGKVLAETVIAEKFDSTSLKAAYDAFKAADPTTYPAVYDMKLENNVLTVETRQVDTEEESGRKTFKYEVGSDKVKFDKAINAAKQELKPDFQNTWITKDIDGFQVETKSGATIGSDLEDKHLYTVTITDVSNEYTAKLSDLYDGLFLTEKGQELFDTLKAYDAEGYANGYIVRGEGDIKTNANGLYSLTIELEKPLNKKTVKNVVTITTNDYEKLVLFRNGIAVKGTTHHGTKNVRKFPVQKLEGANRFDTAVKVAKENADIKTVAENGNIVLVNSDSLVDGLAAAPLAASVVKNGNTINGNGGSWDGKQSNYVAPILLTNANGIPKETKDYMKEVVAHQRVGALDKVTVYLVGGEAVISKAVENDLKEIGLRVVRAGGKDREATSLKVAELMKKDTSATAYTEAFLIGANGEADAMSIASYAAEHKTPVIVESVHGLSDDAVEFFKGYKNDNFAGKNVTIIGGEKVVSKATEETLKAEKIKTDRLAGAKRKETNAEVINTLYANRELDQLVVSKDDVLIDALTATSLAAKDHSPIVLGTNELTKEQINALELKSSRNGVYVYQVGKGVAESVIRTIATRIGLAK